MKRVVAYGFLRVEMFLIRSIERPDGGCEQVSVTQLQVNGIFSLEYLT